MNYVTLTGGKIQIRFADEEKTTHTFKPEEHERMGDLIAKHQAWRFMCSSSCDFPHENGFRRSFDVSDVLSKAVAHAREVTAIGVEPAPIGEASDRIEQVVKAAGVFPLSLKFLRSGKKGEDVTVTFEEERDFEFFTGGIRYAARLAACNGHGSWNASASATPNGAPIAASAVPTRASRRTATAKASRSTGGSAKPAARSARTKRGSSPKNRRG